MTDPTTDVVRQVLAHHGALRVPAEGIADDADLYDLGLTSRTQVSVMLALEDACCFEFAPEHAVRSTFGSVARIVAAMRASGVTELADATGVTGVAGADAP